MREGAVPVVLLFAAFGAAGCPGSLADPAAFEAALALDGGESPVATAADAGNVGAACPDVPTTLATSCGTAGCHDATTKAEGLDLASPDVVSRLLGVAAIEGSGALIDPVSPASSVVYTKLTASPPFGARMPSAQMPLADATIQCVLGWVVAEAGSAHPLPPAGDGDAGGTGGGPEPVDAGGGADGASGASFAAIRVAVGQTTAVTDAQGNVWSADEDFTGGMTAVASPPNAIAGTDTPALYRGQRYGDPSFSYAFPVPNGTYTVTLRFAEQFVTAPQMREFDIAINGATVATNFDIYAAAGAAMKAVDKSFTVSATGGAIGIDFTPGAVQNPMVDAIAVTQGAADGGT